MRKKNIYFFIGTTAELIKLAPVIRELNRRKVKFKIVTSGQNQVNFKDFKYIIGNQKPYYSFVIKPINLPLNMLLHFLLWSLRSFFIYLINFRKIIKNVERGKVIFIVHGDTVTAALGAIIGKIYNLKVVHIESGYRSFNFFEPFPEEICRSAISYLAQMHFCPNEWSLNNIKNRKGIKISTGQNTAYESCFTSLRAKYYSKYLKGFSRQKFFLLVLHRQEHVIYKKELTKRYMNTLINFANHSNIKCVFIMHWITKVFLEENNLYEKIKNNSNIMVIPRIPHQEFIKILEKAEFIATDGGSNQEEAYYLGKPCILLRKYTEQIEGLDSCVILAKDNLQTVKNFLKDYKGKESRKISVSIPPSKIIVDHLLQS